MAWSSPMTAIANSVFLAAEYNQHIRDNLLETAPAKASSIGSLFRTRTFHNIIEDELHNMPLTDDYDVPDLGVAPSCMLQRTSDFFLSGSSSIITGWSALRNDSYNGQLMFPGGQSDHITIPKDGTYDIGAWLRFEANTGGDARTIYIIADATVPANGQNITHTMDPVVTPGFGCTVVAEMRFPISAGVEWRVRATQDSGGSLNVLGSTQAPMLFWCNYVPDNGD